MDLTGIENEADFFPAGTLGKELKEELDGIVARWRESGFGGETPVDRLEAGVPGLLERLRRLRSTADSEQRSEIRGEITHALVETLGYSYARVAAQTAWDEAPVVPRLSRAADADGRDVIWLIEAPTPARGEDSADPLQAVFEPGQIVAEAGEDVGDRPILDILGDGLFSLRNGPRFVLVLGAFQLVLVDRNKWPARSVLRFDLQEIFSRRDTDALRLMVALLSREARAPENGIPVADQLEQEAQRRANAVTTSLKKTVRDAIETLGQEVLDVTGGKHPARDRWIRDEELSEECLYYMYRLLFLLYAEANPALGVVDLRDPVYASGYSMQALRELEAVPLRTPAEREGTYLWESLQRTLRLFYDGEAKLLRLPAVKVPLLDPEKTPILNRVMLRNEAIQKIIRQLSLEETSKGTRRISYARLGIGQLGAVYETLISFTGFVAKQPLVELKPKGIKKTASEDEGDVEGVDEDPDPETEAEEGETGPSSRGNEVDVLAPSYFVPQPRAREFAPEEIVYDGPRPRVYEKGTFIYRLSGRDREKNASYYTPEPLARLLVKHTLMERCKGLAADEILELKVLEPAMGSAAFLVETTNQLADLYLERKQAELGRTIPQDEILIEKQKVRAYIADRNCFGVDLNPTAVDLAAISLWLNGLHASAFSPWFGDQLHAGNSLIGARRAAYRPEMMQARRQADLWFKHPPEEIGWTGNLPDGHIWQFLLPADDMARFEGDKSISEFAGSAQERIKAWRKGGFFRKLEDREIRMLQKLSRVAEALFHQVADDLAATRAASNDAITLWPDKEMPGVQGLHHHEKERVVGRLRGDDHPANTLPYKRLKTAMDAWCALWFWPLDRADKLPSRAEFLNGMAMLLEGGYITDGTLSAPSIEAFSDPQQSLLDALEPDAPARDLFAATAKREKSGPPIRPTNVEALIESMDWLRIAAEVAERERFMHFDLAFADVLRARGGFDLIVGNPPWAKPSWNEGDVIGEIDPAFVIRKLSASGVKNVRAEALAKPEDRKRFLDAYASAKGAMHATGSGVMNPFAGGGSNNLYRCFIDLSFRLMAPEGTTGLIHQDGHLGDPKSGDFRRHWYQRIAKHFEFDNIISSKNFTEIAAYKRFSLNVYRAASAKIKFDQFTFALLASQIEDSYAHDGSGPVPNIKGSDGRWETRGHRGRIIRIDDEALSVIHSLAEESGVSVDKTRFIQPYSASMLDVFRQLAQFPKLDEAIPRIERTVETATGERTVDIPLWQMSAHWNETAAQKDGTIRRETAFRDPEDMILQGPHFHVAHPLYKTPKPTSRTKSDYTVIDLASAPEDYLPRTNYGPAVDQADYRRHMTRCRWDPTKSHADFYRVAFRNMINLNSERSLIGALIPKGAAHVHTVESVGFAWDEDLLNLHSMAVSLPYDFLIKANGRGHIHDSDMARLPWPEVGPTAQHRGLRLACLTSAYADLWDRHAPHLAPLPWSFDDPRLALEGPVEGPPTWDRSAGLRTEFSRRLALVEIDVLVAQALGLTLDQLIEIYRIYFPVLQENEAGTWYDRNGRIVCTCSKGLPGVGYLENGKSPGRKAWEKILAKQPDELVCTAIDDTQPGGPRKVERRFTGPFDTCDRIADYRRAWAHFEAHRATEAAE